MLGAGVDLAHQALAMTGGDAVVVHERSTLWLLSFAALPFLQAAAIAATRSRLLALAGGVLVGGAVGNLVSAAIWGGVPDAIAAGDVYLSLADVLIAVGILLVVAATTVVAVRNRTRLREPVTR